MKKKRIRAKKKPVILTAWQPWQMEIFQGRPWYLHTHLCVTKCNYHCNGKNGFVLARLVDQLEPPNSHSISMNGQSNSKQLRLAERIINLVAKAATKLLDLVLRVKALLIIKNI